MKKTTRKEVMATHQHVLRIGNCQLQMLLCCHDADAYTSGVYGWNADIYSVGNIAIITGYRSFGDIDCSYELCQKYEELAMAEYNRYHGTPSYSYEKLKTVLTNLLHSFVDEAIATDGKGYDNVVEKSHYQFN